MLPAGEPLSGGGVCGGEEYGEGSDRSPEGCAQLGDLAAMWDNYRAAGYSRLIYTNTVSVLHGAL